MADRLVSVPKPFASGDATDWFQHFDICSKAKFQRFDMCSKANGWSNATKALKLPTLLEGEALTIWLELSEEQDNYASAKEALVKTMMPMEFVSLDDFYRRKLRPGEALSVFVHAMKRTGHAKPGQAGL